MYPAHGMNGPRLIPTPNGVMNMYSQQAKQYLMQLMKGDITLKQLEVINTDEAREAISFSARLFGELTQETRTIYEAMKSTFVTKMKRSAATRDMLHKAGISPEAANALMGKTVECTIGWGWMNMSDDPHIKIVTKLPNGWNGYHFPLQVFLQDREANQCRRIFKWVKARQE